MCAGKMEAHFWTQIPYIREFHITHFKNEMTLPVQPSTTAVEQAKYVTAIARGFPGVDYWRYARWPVLITSVAPHRHL